MATREQVLRAVGSGPSYEAAGKRFGIPPGQAFMSATGVPADGGDTLTPAERERRGFISGSTQHLANPQPPENPTTKESVQRWIKQRAQSDSQMRGAAAQRDARPGEVEDPEGSRDVLDVLTRDHDQVEQLVAQARKHVAFEDIVLLKHPANQLGRTDPTEHNTSDQ